MAHIQYIARIHIGGLVPKSALLDPESTRSLPPFLTAATGMDAHMMVADAVASLNARMGLPGGLAAVGVSSDCFERVIDGALADHCRKTNPRPATRDDCRAMLESSIQLREATA